MAERYGTDLNGLGGYEGGVTSENGAALVSTSSDGETSLLFGSAALREIQAGVANGDFAISPDDSTGTITAENPLPYWTFTDVNSAGAITCAIVPSAAVGSGNLLKFTVANGTLTGKSATLTRFIPVPASASRSFSYYLEASFLNGTPGADGAKATVQVSGQFYEQDQTTATGSPFIGDADAFNLFGATATGVVAPALYSGAPERDNTTAPADAAFLKVIVTIATVATQTADIVVSLTEVRAAHGVPELLLTDKDDPGLFNPALISTGFGGLSLLSGDGEGYLGLGFDVELSAGNEINISAAGDILIQTPFDLNVNADNVNIVEPDGATPGRINSGSLRLSDTTDASLSSTGHAFQIGASSGQNLRIDSNEIMVVDNGGTTGMFLQSDGGTLQVGGDTTIVGTLTATNLVSNNDVTLTGTVINQRASATADVWLSSQTGDSVNRFLIEANGNLFWGSGSAARDTNLYRNGANLLQTDDNFQVASQLRVVAPTGTTQTSSQAIYFFVSGNSSYELRRNTSSARYKTNIVDADEVVLEAARKVKPRHYESTIEAEAGATRLGFIAEEIHEAGLTHAVGYDEEGKPETIDPTALIAALWHRVDDLESRLRELEK
jgi:hypothetical protein